jgi:hypothetical protein
MPVGTTSDFTYTRNELIEMALSTIGVTEPSNDEYALASKVLNAMVRHLDAKGQWLWAIDNTESTLTLVSGQQEYVTGALATTISPSILKLEKAALLINSDREPLTILTKRESIKTPLMDESNSQPVAVYLERAALRSNNVMLFYPTPNSAYTVKYNFRRPLFDFDGPTNNPDFPQDWFMPITKMLAYELSSHYGKPLAERQLLKADADLSFSESETFNDDEPSYSPAKTEYF